VGLSGRPSNHLAHRQPVGTKSFIGATARTAWSDVSWPQEPPCLGDPVLKPAEHLDPVLVAAALDGGPLTAGTEDFACEGELSPYSARVQSRSDNG
jgi:hypothetical protein